MEIATKMFLKPGDVVPCVNLPLSIGKTDLDLQSSDFNEIKIAGHTGQVKAAFVFVENSGQLEAALPELSVLWDARINFWVFYPKKPSLNTDLSRDATWKLMRRAEMNGTRQVGINDEWSCMYFKNSGKADYTEIA